MRQNHQLSDDELSRLYSRMAELEQDRTWRKCCFFVRFLLATGTKLSEAQHVRFQDIFLEYDPPVIFVQNLCHGSKPRYVQVLPEFAPILRGHIARRGNPHPHYYLFQGLERGTCCNRSTLRGYWRAVLREAGINHRPPNPYIRSTVSVFTSERLPTAYQNLAGFQQYAPVCA
jgi:integrase